jgi:hypothetical protein
MIVWMYNVVLVFLYFWAMGLIMLCATLPLPSHGLKGYRAFIHELGFLFGIVLWPIPLVQGFINGMRDR